ncbi:outer membrane protein, partial [Croceicoccus bisphenolivorans]|uniref:outer membrane protein n=1 Tax=Croceicoccus bisphenolivorans TaxID=1783232 RepID=UPI000AE79B40
MRKLVIGLAMASTALATPALARDDAWYIELDGGIMLPEDTDLTVDDEANAGSVDWDYGYDFGGIVGYDFGMFRLEAEAAYKGADDDGATLDGVTYEDEDVAVNFDTLSFMLNGLIDFGDDDGLQGFVGGGVGVARTSLDVSLNDDDPDLLDDSDTGFAWQILAGVRAPLTDNWDVGLKYRYFRHDDIDLMSVDGTPVNHDIRTHSLLGTLTYNFGMAPPPP